MSEMKAARAGPQHSSLGGEIVGRINELAAISETPERLTRIFLTKEHRGAAELILSWMRDAGMGANLDAIGNVRSELAAISETPERLTRIFLTKEHRGAAELILSWMRDAGMGANLDAIGNVCGRYEGERPGLPCLMLGSHYDTVRDAGKW